MIETLIDGNYEKDFLLYDKESGKPTKVRANRTGKNWMAICPKHDDTNPSLAINKKGGYYNCFGCGWSGRLYDPEYSKSSQGKKEVTCYDYFDENGELLFQCVRYEPKSFSFRRPAGNGDWIYDLKNVETVPYKLSEILSSEKADPIYIAEGEKDADYLDLLGFIATTNPLGAGNWNDEYNKYFKDRIVILIPDNDKKGIEHCIDIGKNLTGIAKEIKWLEIPGLDNKEDISDWICQGNGKEEFESLLSDCVHFHDIELDKIIESMEKFEVRPYSNRIISKYDIRYDEFRRLWIYDKGNGTWILHAEEDLNSMLRNDILRSDHIKGHYVEEVIKDVKGLTFSRKKTNEPDLNLIPFNDKIYDLKKGELLDYGPEYFFINKIQTNIDTDNNECPIIDKLFEDFVGEEKETLYELCAYCLHRDYPFQKFFISLGEGRNGKSTFCSILSRFLGQQNVSSATLKELMKNKFAPSQLFGKLLNICGEIDATVFKDTSTLKQLTGGDLMNCERKFKDPFSFRNYSKLLITPNRLPETMDRSEGFFRRVHITKFPNKFDEGNNADPLILSKITNSEMEGLAKQAIIRLKRLHANSFIFSINRSLEEVSSTYDDLSSYLNDFLKENIIASKNDWIQVSEFKEMFDAYLEGFKVQPWSFGRIKRFMEFHGYFQKHTGVQKTDTDEDTTNRVWSGLKWKHLF